MKTEEKKSQKRGMDCAPVDSCFFRRCSNTVQQRTAQLPELERVEHAKDFAYGELAPKVGNTKYWTVA